MLQGMESLKCHLHIYDVTKVKKKLSFFSLHRIHCKSKEDYHNTTMTHDAGDFYSILPTTIRPRRIQPGKKTILVSVLLSFMLLMSQLLRALQLDQPPRLSNVHIMNVSWALTIWLVELLSILLFIFIVSNLVRKFSNEKWLWFHQGNHFEHFLQWKLDCHPLKLHNLIFLKYDYIWFWVIVNSVLYDRWK